MSKKKQIEDGVYESPAHAVATVKDEPTVSATAEKAEPTVETTLDPKPEHQAEPRAETWEELHAPGVPTGPNPVATMRAYQKACAVAGMDEEAFFDMIQAYLETEGHPRTRGLRPQDMAGIPPHPEIRTTPSEDGFLFESAIRGSRFALRLIGTDKDREELWPAIQAAFKEANDLSEVVLPDKVVMA